MPARKKKVADPKTDTFGLENASQEYALGNNGQQRIFDLVNARQDAGWSVVYMGATADAKAVGAQMGVNANNSMAYAGTGASVTGSYGALGAATRMYRGVATASAGPPTATTSFFSSIGVAAIDDEGNAVGDDDNDTKGKLAGPRGPLP